MCSIRNEASEKRAIFEQAVALDSAWLQKQTLPSRQLMHIATCIRTLQRDTASHRCVQESRSGPFLICVRRAGSIPRCTCPALPGDRKITGLYTAGMPDHGSCCERQIISRWSFLPVAADSAGVSGLSGTRSGQQFVRLRIMHTRPAWRKDSVSDVRQPTDM